MLAQVAKEPLGTKGARLTSHASLAGRFLVFMPTVDHIGVSRKIESRDERARLRGIVREYREQQGFTGGIIIRTAAAGRSKEDILVDLDYFNRIWTEVRKKTDALRAAGGRLPRGQPRGQAAARSADRGVLRGPHRSSRRSTSECCSSSSGSCRRSRRAVKLYDKPFPIFEEYGVQAELDKALRSKVWLKSGGSIVINQTEALVAIDVNTGRYVGKRTAGRLEDTIVKTNLEAAKEIVRQIRLRDLGGIIVLDFIDMEDRKNRQKVFQALEQELQARSRAVEGAAGVGLRPDRDYPQAREAEPRTGADRAVSVLLGQRRHQGELDDLLRDPGGSEEARRGAERPRGGAPGQPGHRAGAEGRRDRGPERSAAWCSARKSRSSPTPTSTTSSST